MISILKRFLPFLGTVIAFLVHVLIEDDIEHPEAEDTYYSYFLYFFLTVTFIISERSLNIPARFGAASALLSPLSISPSASTLFCPFCSSRNTTTFWRCSSKATTLS